MRILVVDDHPLIPEALAVTLGVLEPGCVVEAAPDLDSALRVSGQSPAPDMVLLDLGLPGQRGLTALSVFREAQPSLPVVILSADASRDRVLSALELGAMGFIPKTARKEVLLGALRLAISGGIYIPPEVLATGTDTPLATEADATRSCTPEELGMTERQAEVCVLLLRGLSNKMIGKELGLAEGTVKIHVSAVLKLLGATNRMQAVLSAHRRGLRVPHAASAGGSGTH